MSQQQPQIKYRQDYLPPAYLVDKVDLTFDILEDTQTRVRARMVIHRNPESTAANVLQLDGSATLLSVVLDGDQLQPGAYHQHAEGLAIPNVPD
ncbi:MAG: aminopeptidase N, partial [Vogesella sp.]